MRKGIFFTMDSVFAFLILITIYGVFSLLSIETVSAEVMHENLHTYAEDMIDVMSKMRLWDIRSEPIVMGICNSNAMNLSDINKTALDAVGALWATNETRNKDMASELTSLLFQNAIPQSLEWGLQVKNGDERDIIYNTTELLPGRYMSSVSRRLVSGYMKGSPTSGFTTRAFLANIVEKRDSEYIFFGGFVGQGNITVYLREVPSDASVSELYMEMALGGDFNLFVNGTSCGLFTHTPALYSVDNWSITDQNCLRNIEKGKETRLDLVFIDPLNRDYIGGGYIRARFDSSRLQPPSPPVKTYHFPGIDGMVNLYDSFFVPGQITSITGVLHLKSDYDMLLSIGNQTPVRVNGSPTDQVITLVDANFSSLNYAELSSKTVPLRLGTPSAVLQVDSSAGDIMLVNDVSGSMEWCEDQSQSCCDIPPIGICPGGNNCSCGASGQSCGQDTTFFVSGNITYCGYRWHSGCVSPNQKKIDIAINASNEFLRIVLNNSVNRVGIVEYSSGKTAKSPMPDLFPLSLVVIPLTSVPDIVNTYNIQALIFNNGTSWNGPFNVTFYNSTNVTSPVAIGTFILPSLNLNQSVLVEMNWTVRLAYGTTNITVSVDPENSVSEFDETNNNRSSIIRVAPPNLRATIFRVYKGSRHGYGYNGSTSPILCQNASNTTVYVTVTETQGIEVNNFDMNLSLDTTLLNGTRFYVPLDYRQINLSPYAGLTYPVYVNGDVFENFANTYNLWDNAVEPYSFRLVVNADYRGLITETDESDNIGYYYMWARRPDLVPYAFDMIPDGLCAGVHSLQLTSAARADTVCPVYDPFTITIYQDGVPVITHAVDYLNESNGTFIDSYGQTPTFIDTYTANFTADSTFMAWVDNPPAPNGRVVESNEANNQVTHFLDVITAPDLVITGIGPTAPIANFERINNPAHAAPGDFDAGYFHGICYGENIPLTFSVAVTNRGCPITDDFNLTLSEDLYRTPGSPTLLGTHVIHGLGQGATLVENFGITLNTMSDLRMFAIADSDNSIAEYDEANNRADYIFQERTSNLNVVNIRSIPPGVSEFWVRSYGEWVIFCKQPGNYILDMNITNDGPCNIYRPFNASFGFWGSNNSWPWPTVTMSLYQQTIAGLNRGQIASVHYVWNGISPFLGTHVSQLNDRGFTIYGYADYTPDPYGLIPIPPVGDGSVWENHEAPIPQLPTDNYKYSSFEMNFVRTALTNISAGLLANNLVQINATVQNRHNYCPTPRDFDVNFFAPNFNGLSDRINRTNVPVILNPGQTYDTSVTWSRLIQNDTTYNIYGWSNMGYAGGATPPGDAFYDEDNWACHYGAPPSCTSINMTGLFISSAGHGAPFIEYLRQALLSKPQQKQQALEISDFSVSPSQAVCGSHGKYQITATITNTGNVASQGTVGFYKQNEKLDSIQILTLAPGDSTRVSMRWEGVLTEDTVFSASLGTSSKSFVVKDPPCPNSPDTTLFSDGIVRAHALDSNITELSSFVNDSETWGGTCICCGIIRAQNMILAQSVPGRLRSMVVMSDGRANIGCAGMGSGLTGDPIEDTVQAACNAYNNNGIIIYTVGFGSDVDADTLNRTALCANGSYFDAKDTSRLMDAYRAIAAQLLNISYSHQVVESTGASKTTLYPDSYLQFTYTPKITDLGYRDLITTVETDPFPSCSGSFQVPAALTPFDVKVTSYSSDFWTSEVKVSNSTGTWSVYNLSYFGSNFNSLGDPFIVEFDPTDPLGAGAQYPGIISIAPSSNEINVSTGERPGILSPNCPDKNRAIYRAIIHGSVPFSDVLPYAIGRNVRVYYDTNGDGIQDGNVTVSMGKDLENRPFDPTIVEVPFLWEENMNNSVSNAFLKLLRSLNFVTTVDNSNGACTDPPYPPGSSCNPIDVIIPSDIVMRSVAINEVPYMYGPVDIGVVTWIK